MTGTVDRKPRPVTVAHRGASRLAPPNTLRAVEVATRFGLDFAEVDVRLSRDGQLVVVHDAEVRVGGRRQAVADLAADELSRVELGEDQGVPRLAEVLALARGRIGIYAELKGPRSGAAMGDLVRSGGAERVRLICGSFDTTLVEELRAATPAVLRSVLFRSTDAAAMIETCAAVGAAYAHPCFRPLTRALVDALHEAGLLVMAPHTNELDEARAFAALNIDVLASDDPRVLRAL